jgi:murein DD-endopeptidase MepM/ murein hydrolase activator NlpD
MKRRFRWGLAILIVWLALPLTALRAQDDTTTVEPSPADYAAIADAYAELQDSVLTEGVGVVDLFLNGEFETIYERASADLQALVTPEQLETIYGQITAVAPVAERVDYRVFSASGSEIYVGQYTWGEYQITLVVAFNDADEISGLNLSPVLSLPDDPAADYRSAATFRLPFDGLWYTFWGGPDALHNYHVDAPPQRHAFDFLIWKNGSTFKGDGTAREDYYAYGQPVLAPADGEVVVVVNDLPEVLPQVETDEEHPAGNHVVIRVAENEYLFIAHMQPGSIQVSVGDTVQAGQMIGLVGNSGNTSEPHIHIHLQDMPDLFVTDDTGQITGFSDARGLPLYFSAYLANGEPIESGEPLGGQFVQNNP